MIDLVPRSSSRRTRFAALVRRNRGIGTVVFVFLIVVSALDGIGVVELRAQYATPLVVAVTSRQQAFAERYITDIVSSIDGEDADPNADANALVVSADGLLYGGMVPSPQGNVDDLVAIPRSGNPIVRLKLSHERDLVRKLTAQGTALVLEGRSAPSYELDLHALRITGAELSSATGDAAGEEARVAKAGLSNLERIQLTLGALGAFVALGMALLVRRSARRQSGRFRSLVHSSSDLITVVDDHAVASYQSPSSLRVLGYEPEQVVGSVLTELLHPNDKSPVVKTFADLYDRPEATVDLTFRLRHRNGTWITMEGTVRNLLFDKTVGGFVVNTRDITERVRAGTELAAARDAAMEATRLKSQFLASMSHEIRTPMNAVIGLSELLLGTTLNREQREYASGVSTAADGLLAIINDILDFSKIEAGKLHLEIIDFDPSRLLEDVVALLGESAYGKQLELLAHPYPDLPHLVRGDPTRLRQVLVNLVSNAVKFTAVGEVVLRAMPVSDDGHTAVVRFEVRDTGIGIAVEDQHRMFEPFSQADSSTTRRFGGTGLGLAIVRQLVELMGGHLGLDSEVDHGSTFWFELPFEHSGAARPAATPMMPEFRSLHAIVVDDNATNRLILRQQLAAWGIHPDEAEDAPSALDQIRSAATRGEGYDFAILDLNMPDMDGLELARAIKTDPATARAKLFMLSSSGRVPDATADEAGLSGTLSKPVRQSELFNCLIEGLDMDASSTVVPDERGTSERDARSHRDDVVVLLVEDNNMNQLVATRMLAKLGYRADVANNGCEALTAIAAVNYAAVLMDCQMPEMDGYEATRQLRRLEHGTGRHLPVIAMTAAAMQGDREACLDAGMDDYITKPVRPDNIAETLERWIPPEAALPGVRAGAGGTETSSAVDPQRFAILRDLDGGDGQLLAAIIAGYLDESAALLATLREAVAEGDPQSVERAAHTLKGASANIGAVHLTETCTKLEALGRAGALGTARELVEDAATQFDDVCACLAVEVSI
ncbi:MAG TPA: response regulator [Acidimicrobiia bacterium]|nr:response regulator [Acidimicrobiia bacterium]